MAACPNELLSISTLRQTLRYYPTASFSTDTTDNKFRFRVETRVGTTTPRQSNVAVATIATPPGVPDAPENLMATVGYRQVVLTWDPAQPE